jgi:hypothetical protein
MTSSSAFAAGAAAAPIGAPPAAGPGTSPSTGSPTSPTPSAALPRTGGGMGLVALLLLGLGGASTYALRRRPTTD